MAEFTVRVVLHDDPTWEDYDELHGAMAGRHFYREITADSGVRYKLPDAEYYGSGNVTIERARELAALAAATTGKPYTVFVTEGGIRAWQGLERA